MLKKPLILLTIILVGFTLWRNYGVVATHAKVLDSPFGSDTENTNEQKELKESVKNAYKGKNPAEGDTISTSFGHNRYTSGYWIKDREIWQS